MKKAVSVLLSLAMLFCAHPRAFAAAESGNAVHKATATEVHVHEGICVDDHEGIIIDDVGVQKAVDKAIEEGSYELTEWANSVVGKAFYAFTPPIPVDDYVTVTESADSDSYSTDQLSGACCDLPQIYQQLVSNMHTFDVDTGICHRVSKMYIVICKGCNTLRNSYTRNSAGCARIHS